MADVTGRINIKGMSSDGYRALAGLTRAGHPDHVLAEIVKLAASHVNGCHYCIDNHTEAARKVGVPGDKIAATADWRGSDVFDDRERAALALTDMLTVSGSLANATDAAARATWDAAASQFPGDELVQLVMTIVAINAWNRAMISEEAAAG